MARYRTLTARRSDTCRGCERATEPGETIRYGGPGLVYCSTCTPDPDAQPTSTTRERREARAERLRGWADKREVSSTATLERARQMQDIIPFGQPILVGHHSERADRNYRDRIWSTMGRGVEDGRKADEMRSKAANIEAAADVAIYSDDVDAVERLEAKIAFLEAQRDRIKAFNVSCRKGTPDESLLDEGQRGGLASVRKHCPYQLGKKGEMPGYELSNLSGNISRLRKRLETLR
jgi:hypothetical protein